MKAARWSAGTLVILVLTASFYTPNQASQVLLPESETTERVSISSDGEEGDSNSLSPAISEDGRYVAFWSQATNLVANDSNGSGDFFVHDRETGLTTRVSVRSDGGQAGGSGLADVPPSISGDGRYVAFLSTARDLVDGDTNRVEDVFVHDRVTGETRRVSVASDGTEANGHSLWVSMSADGRFVRSNHSPATSLKLTTIGQLMSLFMN